MSKTATLEICIYCNEAAPVWEPIPDLNDNPSWCEIAKDHHNDCEWVLTRAQRLQYLADHDGERPMIFITPDPSCYACHGHGLVHAGSVPAPFGVGSVSLPPEYCDCVLAQLPPDDDREISLVFAEEVQQRDKAEQEAFDYLWLNGLN